MNSHSVRRMAVCSECGELGITDVKPDDDLAALVRIGSGKAQKLAHPGCIPLPLLMVLPRTELQRLRICDVPASVMESILLNLKHRVTQL